MCAYLWIGLAFSLTATLSSGYVASNTENMERELQDAYNEQKMFTRLQEFKDLLVQLMMSSEEKEKTESVAKGMSSIDCSKVTPPRKSLSEFHQGCNSDDVTQTSDCFAAYHGFCTEIHGSSIGVPREHSNGQVALSCISWNSFGYSAFSRLEKYHEGCNSPGKALHRDCLAAIHRICERNEMAGIPQEVQITNGFYGIYSGCFTPDIVTHVPNNKMQSWNPDCKFPNSDSDACFSAASRYCESQGFSGGITQEVNSDGMTVACYTAIYSGNVGITQVHYDDGNECGELTECEVMTELQEISNVGKFRAILSAFVKNLEKGELKSFLENKVIPDLELVARYPDQLQFDMMTLYRNHPTLKDRKCNTVGRAAFAEPIRDIYDKMLNNFQRDASMFDPDYLPYFFEKQYNLRQEIDRLCEHASDRFCQLVPVVETYDTIQDYIDGSREEWKYVVLRLNLLQLKLWDPENALQPLTITTSPHRSKIYTSAIELLVNEFKQEDFTEIMALVTEYPTIECRDSDFESCLLESLIDLLGSYVASTMESESQEDRSKIVYANIDYRAYLMQRALTEVLQVTQSTQTGLTEVADYVNRQIQCSGDRLASGIFLEVRNYFSALHTFDRDKATYDVLYIQDTLDFYRDRALSVSSDVDKNVNAVLDGAVVSALGNLAYQTAKLAIAIAESFNPLGWLFGSNDADDVLEALEEVSEAAGLQLRANALVSLLNDIKGLVKEVRQGYMENADYLDMVKTLVDNIDESDDEFGDLQEAFLESYKNYAPAVTQDQLTQIGSTLEAVVTESCNIIEATTGPPVVIEIYKIYASRECVNAAIQIEILRTIYDEIYNFQFELIETLASVVRAKTGLNAANMIGSSWEMAVSKCDDTDALDRYAMLGGVTYVIYNIEKWRAVEEYCDRLEYENGGIRPGVCTGRSTDVANLVSFKPESCIGYRSTSRIYSIPAKISPDGDYSSLNVTALLSGEAVSFKVPDSDWLIQHDFIQPHEKDYAIYVRGFEIYLPVESSTQMAVFVRASSASNNQLLPGGTTYPIFPNRPLATEYLEGHNTKCHKFSPHPYSQCDSTSLPDICRFSSAQQDFIAPSIYSDWSLQVTGYEMTESFRPATDMGVLVSMDICKKSRGVRAQHDSALTEKEMARTMQSLNKCCSGDQYWSSGSCVLCPSGTESALHGYFCKDIDECREGSVCEESCYNTIGSFQCLCKQGYRLNNDSYSCSDIDECAEGRHRCEQNCTNEIGSYSCSCDEGSLREDGYRCGSITADACIDVIEITARTGTVRNHLFATEILPKYTALRVDVNGRQHFATIGGVKWYKSLIKRRYRGSDFQPPLPSCLKKEMIENVFLSARGIDGWFVASATTTIEVAGTMERLTHNPSLKKHVRWGKNIRLTMVSET